VLQVAGEENLETGKIATSRTPLLRQTTAQESQAQSEQAIRDINQTMREWVVPIELELPGQSSALTVASGTSRLCLDANYLPRQRVGHSSQSNSRHHRGKSHSKTRHLKFCRPEKSAGIQVHIHRRALDSDPLVAREKRTHRSPALKKASRLEHSGHSVLQLPSLNHWQYQTLRLTWKVLQSALGEESAQPGSCGRQQDRKRLKTAIC